ncbi:MAG: hypothetical protein BGO98_23960 [Myxococcales bacterium 68-20]|nr:hypothetical protein [Myxococcales bacterium]OJY15729.1 MAG: hypothetical protein BGO98_23960 [Myxococcales bacterium 68-20]
MLSLLRRLPPRIGIIFAAALALYTTHKLYTMCRIRGFVGEHRIEAHQVTGKTVERGAKSRTFCFVSWAEDARENDRRHRVQVDCDYWETVKTDDRIEVVRLDGDGDAYLRGGDVYTSNGQFILDLVLLGAELAGILYYWSRTKEHSQSPPASFTPRARKEPPRP